ncbi:MAG: Maf family protein [Candidatus Moranbacteria bacterium]|nr:Maf family protein [Candidatus Moranbacteria bacterium]
MARHYKDAIIIGADSIIVYEGKPLGKPKGKKEAEKMIKNYSGKEHEAISGFAVIDTRSGKVINGISRAKVKFKKLNNQEINDYIETGEPFDKAGGYGLQNLAAVLIEEIHGDFYAVVGLPLNKLYKALKNVGLDVIKEF